MASTTQAVPSRETCQNEFEGAIAMALQLWEPLSFAVERHLGGGDGADKRDWFGGAVAELFEESWAATTKIPATTSNTLVEDMLMDVESRLIQVMDDEFATVVDDGTPFDIAKQIVDVWVQCRRGQLDGVAALRRRWEASRGRGVSGNFRSQKAANDDEEWGTDDEDDEDEDDEDEDEDADVHMDEAPALVRDEKKPPEVDEDGFTTVTRKKR